MVAKSGCENNHDHHHGEDDNDNGKILLERPIEKGNHNQDHHYNHHHNPETQNHNPQKCGRSHDHNHHGAVAVVEAVAGSNPTEVLFHLDHNHALNHNHNHYYKGFSNHAHNHASHHTRHAPQAQIEILPLLLKVQIKILPHLPTTISKN